MKRIFIFLLFLFSINLFAQEENIDKTPKTYSFAIFDGTLDSFTMRQMDINYLTVSRLINRGIENIFDNKTFLKIKISDWINYTWPMFTYAGTHEEGHRSILTSQKIGSISQPFFNLHGAAYVKGVTDDTLINFRNTNKDSFIRMYTAGIESDYMMAKREEMSAAFESDSFSILYPDFIIRRMMITSYLCTGIIYDGADKIGGIYKWLTKPLNLKEEENELERDICGFDTFGATKALFENDYTFHRYVQWNDLTEQEKDFLIKRVGYRAYLNLLSLFLFTKPNICIGENFALSGSFGYALAPFGDFIDENLFFKIRNTSLGDINIFFYARQAQNYKNWYPAFGLGIIDFSPFDWFSISSKVHIWWQPEQLDFYSADSFFGDAFEVTAKLFYVNSNQQSILQKAGLTTSFLIKSNGFIPEIEQHNNHLRLSIGLELFF